MRTLCFVICLLLSTADLNAESARQLVADGNAACRAGNYQDALAAYEEATVELPESAHIYFNKGTVLYWQQEYANATELFEKAALKTRDIRLEARSKFNMGNCSFRESERQRDNDLKKSMAACEKSIRYYQEALELDPDLKEAAENIEVVRLVVKSILDEIKKREEEAKKQQQAQQEMAKQLKQLIEKQEGVLAQNKALADKRRKDGNSQDVQKKTRDLANDQAGIGKETGELAQKMPQPQQQPSPTDQAKQHLENATREQNEATGKLEQNRNDAARPNQEQAVDELKKALASLAGKQDNKGQDQQQQQNGEQQQEQQQQEQQQQEQQQQEQQQQEQQQEQMGQQADDAKDILDEEKENRKRRRVQAGGYRSVDRDW